MSGRRRSRKSSPRGSSRPSAERLPAFFPTLVLLNGNIKTMDSTRPSAEAVALFGEHILAIGSNKTIKQIADSETQIVDLRGATVLPGFIDCHSHLVEFGLSMRNLDLRETRSIEELKSLVSNKTTEASRWILGRGWDQEQFAERRYPAKYDLDEVSPDKPVFLRRVCGHIAVANSAALREAKITSATTDPVGGIIDRDNSGEPTGILREQATDLVERYIPEPSAEDCETAALAAGRIAVGAGLTSVHCIISSERELRALLNLKLEGRLPLRFYVFIPPEQMGAIKQLGLTRGFGDDWVRLGGIKLFVDGSLGARTAALEAPYTDQKDNRGVAIYTQKDLDRVVAECHLENLQVAIHAIGDRAIAMALDSVRKVKSGAPHKDSRHRIEHASVLNPELVHLFKHLEVIASVQPHFVVSDFWIEQRLGRERSKYAYSFSSLLRAGVMTVAGSDCPIEPLSPLQGIQAAVTRPGSDEAIGVEDAVKMYTRNAAYASFEEKTKGTISPGKLADMVVLSRDPYLVPANSIKQIDVLMTIVGGRIVYSSPSCPKLVKKEHNATDRASSVLKSNRKEDRNLQTRQTASQQTAFIKVYSTRDQLTFA